MNSASGSMICNGVNPKISNCSKNGIAWDSDKRVKFRPPDFNSTMKNYWWSNSYANETGHLLPKTFDEENPQEPNEDLIVWVRTAALPNFRKLYRIINVDLPKGVYYLNVTQSMLSF